LAADARPVRVIHFATTSIMHKAFILPLARWQRDHGYAVEFGCGEDIQPGYGPEVAALEAAGFRVHVIPFPYRIRPIADVVALARLWRFFRRERFDVVHTHTSKAGVLVRAAARMAGCPRVVHTVHIFHFRKFGPGVRRWFFVWLERLAGRWTDVIYCTGRVIHDEAHLARIAPDSKLLVIGGAIGDLERFSVASGQAAALRAELGLGESEPIVACVTRLVDYKGVDTLLLAARLVLRVMPAVRFVVMGGGPLESELRALAARLGVERSVIFTGNRDQRDVVRLLAASAVFCLPTRYEAFGVAFVEAMAVGCPPVGPRLAAVESIVEDGVTGILVPRQGDDAAYAEAILTLLADPWLRARLAQAGMRQVREAMAPETTYETVTDAYARGRTA
jgi:glycosyltransferase involved in cell wall biosynthesis